jgi:hypothetical protein
MMKTVLILNADDVARSPAILCAENDGEAQSRQLPLFTSVFAQLITGLDLYPNGDGYDLFDKGDRVGSLEVFATPQEEASIYGK